MGYAEDTRLSIERSKHDIEALLERAGATKFGYSTTLQQAQIMFMLRERCIRYTLRLPDPKDKAIVFTKHHRWMRSPTEQKKAWEQACRSRWRALFLVIRAKLEAIEAGITTLEEEFFAQTLLPSGQTVVEAAGAAVQEAYRTGAQPDLLLRQGVLPAPATDAEIVNAE